MIGISCPGVVTSTRFGNGKAVGLFALAASIGVIIPILPRGPLDPIALLAVLYFLQAAAAMAMGVVVANDNIHFPRLIAKYPPILFFWRLRRPIAQLDHITYLGRSFGLEWVLLDFGAEKYFASFAERDRRLAFFEAARAKKPKVRIYRTS